MDTVFVKPRRLDGGGYALVRMPERGFAPLPSTGALVPYDEYWARRIRDEDVKEAKEPAEAPASDKTPDPAPKLDTAAKSVPASTKES